MTRLLLAVLVFAGLVAGATAVLLPPPRVAAIAPDFNLAFPVARGAYHVHSRDSDGTGTRTEIAAAAAEAGLQFVIVTDHGDGTRVPAAPAYHSGVLVLDGVEISTQYGHYVVIDLPQAPYPLAGHPRDVVEDVRRLGGFGFAAHPGSPKAALQWEDWNAAFDGIEWLNADSEWRDELWGSLGRVLLTYSFRPIETLTALLDRPESVLEQWTRLTAQRRVPAIAGADAHARLGFRQASDPYEDRVLARVPSYEVSFSAFVNHVILNAALSGDAVTDAAVITNGIREGRMFTSVDGVAGLSAFEAKATSGRWTARLGEYLDLDGPAVIEARISGPEGTTLAVYRDGSLLYETEDESLRLDVGKQAGAYHVEARLPANIRAPSVPWVLTNPMYIAIRETHAARAALAAPVAATIRTAVATASWRAEASEGSSSALRPSALPDSTPALEWQFALANGERAGQYAAMRFPVDAGLSGHDRVQLRAESDAPRRVWAQLRAPGSRGGERWGKTFYIHDSLAPIELRFDDFRPLGPTSTERPPLDRVDSLLLVIDTVNTPPGARGRIWIPDLWLAR